MENEFPPNSHAKKEVRPARTETKADKKDVQRVTKSRAIQRKKPLHRKFLEAFKPEDIHDTVEHGIFEVLIPGVKDLVSDTVSSAVESALGVNRSSRRSRRGGQEGGFTSYNRMGSARPRGRGRDEERRPSRRSESIPPEHNQIILPDRVEANEVVDGMFELLSKYDVVTMRDMLSLCGEPHSFTDEDWGWTDLRGARVHKVREGYLIDLPRPEALD